MTINAHETRLPVQLEQYGAVTEGAVSEGWSALPPGIATRLDRVASSRVDEVVDRLDFTRDRNVVDHRRRPVTRPGSDNHRSTGGRGGTGSGQSLVEHASSPPQDDRATVAPARRDPDDDVIFVGVARPCTGDLAAVDHIGTTAAAARTAGRRPIDTVDRARSPARPAATVRDMQS